MSIYAKIDNTCANCPFDRKDADYCEIQAKTYSPNLLMCLEAVDERLKRIDKEKEKYKKDKASTKKLHRIELSYNKLKLKLIEERTDEALSREDAKKGVSITLNDISKAKYYDMPFRVKTVIMGKDYIPYIIPKKIEVSCPVGKLRSQDPRTKCSQCPYVSEKKEIIIDYEHNKKKILEFIDVNSGQIKGLMRTMANIPDCKSAKFDVKEMQNLEQLSLIPELKADMVNYKYTIKKAFYLGEGLEPNQVYELAGTTLPDSKNQLATFIAKNAEQGKNDIDNFTLDEDIKRGLRKFRIKEGQSIANKLDEIYNDFVHNIDPPIYGRKNLHFAVDLVYHSVLSFNFMGLTVNKGWTEILILGDTRAGKTQLVKKMVHHYQGGEFVTSGENTTFAGLIAGVQQTGKHWILNWGKWILNHKRALIIDEADGIDPELMGKLSGLRSSGIAEVVKIRRERTMAKTRVIWITNPRRGNMDRYSYGIQAVRELFQRQQDISRLDFVVGVSKGDVSIALINKKHRSNVKHKYTTDICHNLVMFAWSRRHDQIVFEVDAEDLILKKSVYFDKKYTYDIPLVTGAEMRHKIAKLAIALACRLYSTDDTEEVVIINKDHVNFVCNFLEQEYGRASLDYTGYSEQMNMENTLHNEDRLKELTTWNVDIVALLLNTYRYNTGDIQDIFDVGKAEGKKLITEMVKHRALKKSSTYYIKTSAFIEFLKKIKNKLKDMGDEFLI